MFQNKKLKRNATYAIAEVAEVALCASNCALPTSAYFTVGASLVWYWLLAHIKLLNLSMSVVTQERLVLGQ